MKKELVLAQSAASNNKEKAEAAAAETEVSKVSAVRELLAFHQEQCKDSDTRRLDITKEIEDFDKEVREANEALASLRRNEREKSSGRSRDVSILFNAPSDDQVLLRLTWVSWCCCLQRQKSSYMHTYSHTHTVTTCLELVGLHAMMCVCLSPMDHKPCSSLTLVWWNRTRERIGPQLNWRSPLQLHPWVGPRQLHRPKLLSKSYLCYLFSIVLFYYYF